MGKYWIVAYIDDKGGIQFYRTTSVQLLIKKTEELKKDMIVYNTLEVKGYDITFK